MAAPELKTLGRYRIERVLGKGAMGIVYEAFDPRLGRRVAIKTILKSHLDDAAAKDYSMRFEREAQALGRLTHPHIVQVHDFGQERDVAYLVMELVKGRDLKSYFDSNERFDVKETVRMICELCEALEFAHRAGIIHRDVKPGNVMLDGEMRVKLTDFGVARVRDPDAATMTGAATMVGTPAYMSPEQISGRPVDGRTDVFASGVILYQLLTGEMPFTGNRAWTIAKKIMHDEPAAPSTIDETIHPGFDAVLAKALAKQPEQRYRSASAFAGELAFAGKGEDDAATVIRRTSPKERLSLSAISAATTAHWIGGSLVAALIVGAAGWYMAHDANIYPNRSVPDVRSSQTDPKSIAVLPFTNMSDDKEAAYFADGVHEDLLTQLALLRQLKVVSRTSVMDYRNTKKNVRQIGTELGVSSLVEGSVRRAGNQVRITAQLIDAQSDRHLWAKSYDRELKDIFGIQSELAVEITKALKVALQPQETVRLTKRPTDSLEAYDLFLRYQQGANEAAGGARNVGLINERIALLSKSVAVDPTFSLAWARLAAEHARAYAFVDHTPKRLQIAKDAMAHVPSARLEDPLIKTDEGKFYYYAFNDLERAAKAFDTVLASAPYNVEALLALADVRLRQTRWAERAALLERALSVDERNADTLASLASQYAGFRQYVRAQALVQQLIDIRPSDVDLKAKFYRYEYLRSGSWDGYDQWRATLPKDAAHKFARVRQLDLHRAVAQLDLDRAQQLMDLDPQDVKSWTSSPINLAGKAVDRALLLRAKGEVAVARRARACASVPAGAGAATDCGANPREQMEEQLFAARVRASALEAMRILDTELERTTLFYFDQKARLYAILADRESAFDALAKAVRAANTEFGLQGAEMLQRGAASAYALLGERKKALAELRRQLKLPESNVHDMRVNLSLSSLWNDPEFEAMVKEPANNAPLSFDMKYERTANK